MTTSAKLRGLGHGNTVTLGNCEIYAPEILVALPIIIRCRTHHEGDTNCQLQRRSRLRRAWDHQLESIIDTIDVDPGTIEVAFAELAASPDPNSRLISARSERCPLRVLTELANDWWWEVRAGVASNARCPHQVQHTLAIDDNPWVRRALAENQNTDSACIDILAKDSDFGVRDAAAEHPRCPKDSLIKLASDDRWEIRRSIAKRQDAPLTALALLASDPEPWVRFFVAANPTTSSHLRQRLEQDSNAKVRSMVRHASTPAAKVANALAFGLNQLPARGVSADDPHKL